MKTIGQKEPTALLANLRLFYPKSSDFLYFDFRACASGTINAGRLVCWLWGVKFLLFNFDFAHKRR
jgi:hypothetical protein